MTTKIDIVSGFLGAGKTTLIKKLLRDNLTSEKVVLIENEFGEIGIDSGILKNSGIEIKEINSGCICCSLVGDFASALKEVFRKYTPDRVIIEPSGVGKLSGVIEACKKIENQADGAVNMCITVVDATKYKMYINNFGEFFEDQIVNARTIVLSRTQKTAPDKLSAVVKDIQKRNPKATLVTTEWEKLSGTAIIAAAEQGIANSLETQVRLKVTLHRANFSNNTGKLNQMHGNHNHQAGEIFESWGIETPHIFTEDGISHILKEISYENIYGSVLRAKGIVQVEKDSWLQFDYVPGEFEVKPIEPDYTGRICVIGESLDKTALAKLFSI